MPKSAKKRKEKAADFNKVKLKLGKGKRAATNAIDTSYKARSIVLPSQTIREDKDEQTPTTRRKLTFDDLILQLKHYSVGTRKDAITGLRELLEANDEMLDASLTPLIASCVRLIADEDQSVRKVLLAFFSWLLPHIPQDALLPHSPLLLLFTMSAQTHIFPEIRVDAVRFLDLFLELFPQAVVSGWAGNSGCGRQILDGYLGILDAGTMSNDNEPIRATSTASVILTPTSRHAVLRSLSIFLEKATLGVVSKFDDISPHNPFETHFLESSFVSPEAYTSFATLFRPNGDGSQRRFRYREWQEMGGESEDFAPHCRLLLNPGSRNWTMQQLSETSLAAASSDSLSQFSTIEPLARNLKNTLIAAFFESSYVQGTGSDLTSISTIAVVSRIFKTLYNGILQDNSRLMSNSHTLADIASILSHMSTYFPFQAHQGRTPQLEPLFDDTNIVYCELTSLFFFALQQHRSGVSDVGEVMKQATSMRDTLRPRVVNISDHVIRLLQGEPVGDSQLGRPISHALYLRLLPTVWALLNVEPSMQDEISSSVFQAVTDHAIKTSSTSAVKQATIEFMSRIALLETDPLYCGTFKIPVDHQGFEEWLLALPKCLWEVGAKNVSLTATILHFLLRFLQRKSRVINERILPALRSRFIPFFFMSHATRGKLPGPFTKLPSGSSLRRLTLDVAAFILFETGGKGEDLAEAVDMAVSGSVEALYWSHLRSVSRIERGR